MSKLNSILIFSLLLFIINSCGNSDEEQEDISIPNEEIKSDSALILSFEIIDYQIGNTIIDHFNKNLQVNLSASADPKNVYADIKISENAVIELNDGDFENGITKIDLSLENSFKVTAEDKETFNIYLVSYTQEKELLDGNSILAFNIDKQIDSTEFDSIERTIGLTMPFQSDLTELVAEFELSEGAKAYINGDLQISGETSHNFTEIIQYIIVAENGDEALWTVEVIEEVPEFIVYTLVEEFPGNDGVSVDDQGNIYVNGNGALNQWNGSTVHKVTPDGQVSLVNNNLPQWPVGSELDGNGFLYVTGWKPPGTISKINLSKNSFATIYSGISETSGLELDGLGNIYVMEPPTNSILKIDANMTKTTFAQGAPLKKCSGITFDESNQLFYTTNWVNGVISKIDMNGNVSTFVNTGFGNLGPIINNEDYLFTSSYEYHRIIRIDKQSKEIKVIAGTGVSGNRDGAGNKATFRKPLGLGFSPGDSLLYVSEISPLGAGRLRVIKENH